MPLPEKLYQDLLNDGFVTQDEFTDLMDQRRNQMTRAELETHIHQLRTVMTIARMPSLVQEIILRPDLDRLARLVAEEQR